MNAVACVEDELLHLGVPTPRLVSEVDAAREQVLHAHRVLAERRHACLLLKTVTAARARRGGTPTVERRLLFRQTDQWNRAWTALASTSRPTPPRTWGSTGSAWTQRPEMIPQSRYAARVARAVFINNYPTELAIEACLAGDLPRDHLSGIDHLERLGCEVDVVPFTWSRPLRALTRLTGARLGELDRQACAWRLRAGADLVYAASAADLPALAALRASGALRVPLAAYFFHPPSHRAWHTLLRGVDLALCLSFRAPNACCASGSPYRSGGPPPSTGAPTSRSPSSGIPRHSATWS